MNRVWQIIPALPEHIPAIAADMREADRREVWASHRHTQLQALESSLSRSELAWTCLIVSPGTATGRAAERAFFAPEPEIALSGDKRPARASARQDGGPSGMEWIPAFMWGVARVGSLISLKGSPWLLGTNLFFTEQRALHREFLRQCRAYIGQMQSRFPRLENHIHAENALSLRWLKWCGFTIDDVPEVINGEDFYLFWRDAHV